MDYFRSDKMKMGDLWNLPPILKVIGSITYTDQNPYIENPFSGYVTSSTNDLPEKITHIIMGKFEHARNMSINQKLR